MKRLTCILILALCAAMPLFGQRQDPRNLPARAFRCQGLDRTYYLYIPEGLPEGAPLVFYLHGYGSEKPESVPFCDLAEKEKFAVCIPWAAVDPNGEHGWNVGYNMQKGYRIDDIRFLKKLARHLQKEFRLSRENIFVTGHSNGGEMCYLIAYREPEFFRAVAPLSGLTMKWMYEELVPAKPVPLLEIHGTEDRTSEWNGDLKDEYWGPYISVPMSVASWAVAARCDHEVTERIPAASEGGCETVAHRYLSDTNGGVEVSLYEVVGAGHSINAMGLDYAAVVWDFFKRYLK